LFLQTPVADRAEVVAQPHCGRSPAVRILQTVPAAHFLIQLDSIRALRRQPQAAVRNFSIDPDGSFIHWPDLDVHLGWNQFLQAVDPAELRKAQQRSAGFNERYGAAIRRVREAAGILQSKVDGLTGRQERRIEQGENRATTAAIAALAKAHGLDANSYMERLTKAMK
jgi:hypothetical protein